MKSLSLVLRILAIVAAVAAAAIFFMSQGKLAEKQTELDAAKTATQSVQAELAGTNDKVKSLESSLSGEREALAASKRELASKSSEMHIAQQEVTRTQTQLRESKKTIEKLTASAMELRSDLLSAEKSLASASKEAELAQLTERIKELQGANSSLKSELESSKAISEARAATPNATQSAGSTNGGLPVVNYPVNNNPAVQAASIGTKTTIASVSAANGIIVLNATPELGLTPGTEVRLVKDLKAIASVQVISNQGDLAIANILPGSMIDQLVENLTVSILR
ncbi:MAG: hypothetical protein ACSHYA_07155 [Opitutaceae bacterium]